MDRSHLHEVGTGPDNVENFHFSFCLTEFALNRVKFLQGGRSSLLRPVYSGYSDLRREAPVLAQIGPFTGLPSEPNNPLN
jgi:hypothetical protein